MKSLLTTLLLLTSIYSTNSMACSCERAYFSDSDTEQAVINFMESKLDVDQNQIDLLVNKDSEHFITPKIKALLAVFTLGENDNFKACSYDCAAGMNQKSTYSIQYIEDGKSCTQELKVKMISNLTNYGFKSKVKSTQKPICN